MDILKVIEDSGVSQENLPQQMLEALPVAFTKWSRSHGADIPKDSWMIQLSWGSSEPGDTLESPVTRDGMLTFWTKDGTDQRFIRIEGSEVDHEYYRMVGYD